MKFLFYIEMILLLSALLFTLRVFWPVRGQLLGRGDGEILISIRNRHNLKICAGIVLVVIASLPFIF